MYRHTMILMLFVLACAHSAFALDTLLVTSPDPLLESWRWTEINAPDRSLGGIAAIEEDRDGNIWFGSSSTGLHKYDGYHWTRYAPPDSLLDGKLVYINDIKHDQKGNVWVAMWDQGVGRFNGKTWTVYTTKDGLVNLGLRDLQITQNGDIYAGHWGGGLSRFDGATWMPVSLSREYSELRTSSIEEAPDGTLYVGGHASTGVFRYDPKSSESSAWTQYTTIDGLADNKITDIHATKDGSIWAMTGKGPSRFDGVKWHTESAQKGLPENQSYGGLWETADGLLWTHSRKYDLCYFDGTQWQIYVSDALPPVTRGYLTRNGAVWFAKSWGESGVYRFDPTEQWKTYILPDNLFGGYETEDGSIWFTAGNKPVRFYNNQWIAFGPEDGAPDSTVAIFQTRNGDLWFTGTHKGISAIARYSDRIWEIFTLSDGLIDNLGRGMVETQNGDLWFTGSHKGYAAVVRFDGTTWRRFTEGLKGGATVDPYEASDGTLWFGTTRSSEQGNGRNPYGVIRYDGEIWAQYTTPEDGVITGVSWDFAEWPTGTLWVGATDGMSWVDLNTLPDGANWQTKTADDFGVFLPKINALTPTSDGLYFSFFPSRNKGVVRYDGKTWHRITQQNGLAHATVSDILKTDSGTLYFAGQGSLSRFDGKHWTHYIGEYKPIAKALVTHRLREMKDGSIWVLSQSKALRFKPNENLTTPETTLEAAPDLVSSAGNIALHWTGSDKWNRTALRDMHYEYRLNEDSWISAGHNPNHTFTELPDGAHRIAVRAINRYGVADPTPAVQNFIVEAPWWKNPYVLALSLVLISLTGLQTTRLIRRDRRLRETNSALSDANNELFQANLEIKQQSEHKSTFLASMSHEIRTPITSIKGYIDNMLDGIGGALNERQERNLTRVRANTSHLLSLVNDLLDLSKIEAGRMDVTVSTFDVEVVVQSCVSTVAPLVQEGVQLTSDAGNVGEVHTDEARLTQILINLTGNAIKFTEKGRVEVKAKQEGDQLVLSVADTGKGIPEDELPSIFDEYRQVEGSGSSVQQGTGLGLSITKKFAELLGGSIGVESEVGKGSVFTVRIPANYKG